MIFQPISAKLGEVLFRKKLTQQQIGQKIFFPHEYTDKEMYFNIQKKTKRIKKDFAYLKRKQIQLTPFLEIGTGYGQASLFLINELHAKGYASEIAFDPLQAIYRLKRKFKYHKLPQLIICDAENLPFANNSFPFIFCYQTLHHFPHPICVTAEIQRVLQSGGYFFFSEEPIKQQFNIPLWTRPTKLRWWEKILKIFLILPFISKIGKTEIDHHIIEEAFSLKTWHQALDIFDYVECKLAPFPVGPPGQLKKINTVWQPLNWLDRLNRWWLFMLGGGIEGLTRKGNNFAHELRKPPKLACVNCWITNNNNKDRPILIKFGNRLKCPHCRFIYQQKNGMYFLLSKKLLNKLYQTL